MLAPHPAAHAPDEPETTLWRFMDFTKYVAMLDRRAVFFTRADRFADPFEGSYARPNLLRRRGSRGARLRRRVFVNCWHRNPHESAAMWQVYLQSPEGIAIQSTVARVGAGFEPAEERLHLGEVRYLDYEGDAVPEEHDLDPFLCKRASFEYEREVRVLWQATRDEDVDGRYIAADLQAMIERVVISPTAEEWFTELVKSVTDRYGLHLRVEDSELTQEPYDDEAR